MTNSVDGCIRFWIETDSSQTPNLTQFVHFNSIESSSGPSLVSWISSPTIERDIIQTTAVYNEPDRYDSRLSPYSKLVNVDHGRST